MPRSSRASMRWVSLVLAVALLASGVVVYALLQLTDPDGAPPAPGVTVEGLPGSAAGTGDGVSSETSAGSTEPGPTASITLDGSSMTIPAAWTGTAEVTIAVRGTCATAMGSSRYSVPADVALDLPPAGSDPDRIPATVTIGINSTSVPALAVYSASADGQATGGQPYWAINVNSTTGGRAVLSGVLTGADVSGASAVNMLVDAETALQPCEAKPETSVRLPRALANGSTISGWVSADRAELSLKATTTDGQRDITVAISADRTPG